MTHVAVLYGGMSAERPVSLASGKACAAGLERAGFEFEGILHRWGIHPNAGAEPRDVRVYARWRGESAAATSR